MDIQDLRNPKIVKAGTPLLVGTTTVLAAARPEITYDYNRFIVYYFGETGGVHNMTAEPNAIKLLDEASKDVKDLVQKHAPILARNIASSNGSDPEIFVADAEGEVIPAWKFLPDEAKAKADDEMVPGRCIRADGRLPLGIYAFWDGFQAETSLREPHHCHERLTASIWGGLEEINNAARKYDPAAQLIAEDVVKVSRKELLGAEDRHIAFGCAPSENAYGIEPIEIGDPREMPLRFSGTHYHYSNNNFLPKWWPNGTVKMIDKFGGIILTALGRGMDNPKRREFYGRPGEYRCKPNIPGHMEYRTTGSFVMKHPATFIFGADVCRMGYKLGLVVDGNEFDLPDAKDIIMNCDADEAQKVISKNEAFFRKCLGYMYTPQVMEKTMALLLGKFGVKPLVPESVVKNWNLSHVNKAGVTATGSLPGNYRWAHWLPGVMK